MTTPTLMVPPPNVTDEQMAVAWRGLADHFAKDDADGPMVHLLRDAADRLDASRVRLEEAERQMAEYESQDDAEAARRAVYQAAVCGEADKILRAALGPDWSRFWGPTLETLGEAVDVVLAARDAAIARAERAERVVLAARAAVDDPVMGDDTCVVCSCPIDGANQCDTDEPCPGQELRDALRALAATATTEKEPGT